MCSKNYWFERSLDNNATIFFLQFVELMVEIDLD